MKAKALLTTGGLFLAIIMFQGCEEEPKSQLKAAQVSLEKAIDAEATVYASELFANAHALLDSAGVEISAQKSRLAIMRRYQRALALLDSANSLAVRATSDAEAEKRKLQGEVEALLGEAKVKVEVSKLNIEKLQKAKEDVSGIQSQIDSVSADMDLVSTAIADGDLLLAHSTVRSVLNRADSVTAQIEKASAAPVVNRKPGRKK